MYEHQAMLPIPDLLRSAGINVVELDKSYDLYDGSVNWKQNKQGYYFLTPAGRHHGYNGKPNGWVWHHTASSGYTPNVRNKSKQTKAMLYMGLTRGGDRMYQEGGGVPTVAFASAGPANYGNGSGNKGVLLDYVDKDVRFNGPQRSLDTSGFYGNRYYGCTEIVHRGDGSPLDTGVFRMAYMTMAILADHFGWSPWRNIGHLDHTRRKIDPRFEQGSPYTMGFMQDVAQAYDAGIVVPPTPKPPEEENMYIGVEYGDGFKAKPEMKPAVAGWQGTTKLLGNPDGNSGSASGVDGIFGNGTKAATKLTQAKIGVPVTGIADPETRKQAELWLINN